MEKKEHQDISIQALTPKIAWEYLRFKQEYEGKNFISTWENIIPRCFDQEDFCRQINILREKRIEIKNMGKEENKKAFVIAFDTLFEDKIKSKHIDKEKFKQLVGSLMNVYTSPKFKKFTEHYTKDIFHILDQIRQEKHIESKKAQEKREKRYQKEGEWKQKIEKQIEKESTINKDLFDKYTTARQEFIDKKEIGYLLTSEDNDEIFHLAWKEFLQENIMNKKKMDKVYNEFYQKFIY